MRNQPKRNEVVVNSIWTSARPIAPRRLRRPRGPPFQGSRLWLHKFKLISTRSSDYSENHHLAIFVSQATDAKLQFNPFRQSGSEIVHFQITSPSGETAKIIARYTGEQKVRQSNLNHASPLQSSIVKNPIQLGWEHQTKYANTLAD